MEGDDEVGAIAVTRTSGSEEAICAKVDFSNLPVFMLHLPPQEGVVHCYIERDRGIRQLFPTYSMYH